MGFVGVGIQTLSGVFGSFGVYLLGAFVAGFSMCLLNTVVNPMLNRLGGGGNKGNQLIQIGGSFNSLCGTAVIIITGLLIPSIVDAKISDVFPLMYTALGIFAFAFIVILLTKIPENEQKQEATAQIKDGKGPMGRLIGGIIGSKVSAKAMLTVASVVGIILTLLAMFGPSTMVKFPAFNGAKGFGMESIPLNAAFLVCIGLCTSVMWGGIFNLAVEGLGKYTEELPVSSWPWFAVAASCLCCKMPSSTASVVWVTSKAIGSSWSVSATCSSMPSWVRRTSIRTFL